MMDNGYSVTSTNPFYGVSRKRIPDYVLQVTQIEFFAFA